MAIQEVRSIFSVRKRREFHGNRVVSAATPRMATGKSAEAEEGTAPGAMGAQGFDEIGRTRGLEPAAAARAAEHLQERRERKLVCPHEGDEQVFHSESVKIESRRARSNHSPWSSSKGAVAAADLATMTIIWPGAIKGRCARAISRRRRRVLLRATAPPTRLEVTIPICEGVESS